VANNRISLPSPHNSLGCNLYPPSTLHFTRAAHLPHPPAPRGDGGWAKKEKNKNIFWYPMPEKTPSRAGWLKNQALRLMGPKRLGLIWATPWADFAVIGDQLWSTMTAIFWCVALSWLNWSLRARGKRRGFSPGAAARHSHSARVHTDLRQKKIFRKNFCFRLLWLYYGLTEVARELGNIIDSE